MPSCRRIPSAETPRLPVTIRNAAQNQTGSGVRVRWRIVPAVVDAWRPQAAHSMSRRAASGQALPCPQRGHAKPSGQRHSAGYASHASPVGNQRWNSRTVRGNAGRRGAMRGHYMLR